MLADHISRQHRFVIEILTRKEYLLHKFICLTLTVTNLIDEIVKWHSRRSFSNNNVLTLQKTLHSQKAVDIVNSLGIKDPLWLHSQMHFTTVRPSDSKKPDS